MPIPYNKKLKPYSQKLRTCMTRHEVFLWLKICRKQMCGVQFYRQKPIGPYIVDFFANHPKLVIELDGGHHFEPEQEKKDMARDRFLRSLGFTVLRFDNQTLMTNWSEVGQVIVTAIIKDKIK